MTTMTMTAEAESSGSVSASAARAQEMREASNANVGSAKHRKRRATVTVKAGDGPDKTVRAGETVVSAAAAQPPRGVSGNTIISTARTRLSRFRTGRRQRLRRLR